MTLLKLKLSRVLRVVVEVGSETRLVVVGMKRRVVELTRWVVVGGYAGVDFGTRQQTLLAPQMLKDLWVKMRLIKVIVLLLHVRLSKTRRSSNETSKRFEVNRLKKN